MAFVNETTPVPTSIGEMTLRVMTDGQGGEYAFYYYEVLDQFGNVLKRREGEAQPHLTPQEITGIQSLMTRVRGLAEASLPTP